MDFYLFVDFELEFWFLYLLGHAHVLDDPPGGASLGGVPEVNYYYFFYIFIIINTLLKRK